VRVLNPDNGLLKGDVHVILIIEVFDSEVIEFVVSTDAEAIPAHPGVERLNLWCDNSASWLLEAALSWWVLLQLTNGNTLESIEPWSTLAMRLPLAITILASAINVQSLLSFAFIAVFVDNVVMNSETIVHASHLAMFLGCLLIESAENIDIITLLDSGSWIPDGASLAPSKRSDPFVLKLFGLLVSDSLAASTSL